MPGRRREEALAVIERRCPRCGAPRERRQAYCVECGLRLPALQGALPGLRRGWVRSFGWYPGDWIWASIPALAVAAGGAAVAIAFGGTSSTSAATTVIAIHRPARAKPVTTAGKNGRTAWPARDGWTVAIVSYPVHGGNAPALATANRAARGGLPEVGVLHSSAFSSLHPGYYIVFSGIYSTLAEAQAALPSVRASGFSSAYPRQISR
jgi:hypothetical protein